MALTGATTAFSSITANENVNVTAGGTIGTGGTVATINVATGKNLNFGTQAFSTAAGTGFVKAGDGILTLAGGTYAGGFTLNAGTVAVGGVNAMGSGGALVINGGTIRSNSTSARDLSGKYSGGITIGGNFTLGDATNNGLLTFSNNIALGAATRTITTASSAVFGGVISGSSGVGLTKAGTGNLTLSGANDFTGLTTVNAGGLVVGNSSALGTTAAGTTVASNARVELAGVTVTGEAITLNGNGGNFFGALQSRTGTGTSTWAGSVTIGANDTRIGAQATSSLEVSGIIDDGTSDFRVLFRPENATASVTVSGANTYTGGTSLAGDGPVNVSSLNKVVGGSASSSFGAPTTVANGLIIIGTTTANGNLRYIGAGETTDRTIQIGVNNATPAATDVGGAIIQSEGTGGALIFSAPNFNNPTNAATGAGANRTLTLQGANTAANTISGIIQNNIVSGTATGTATVGLIKAGSGRWVLAGANNYTGTTSVNAGTLALTGSGTVGAASSQLDINGGTLDLGGTTQTKSSVVRFLSGTTSNGTITKSSADYDGQAGVVSAVLNGAVGLNKTTTGTLTLSNANGYAGLTTVAAGVLIASNATALGTTAAGTTVANDARLELAGVTITGEALTISGGGGNFFGALQSSAASGASTWTGNVTIGADSTRIGAQANSSLEVSGIIDDGASDFRVVFRPESASAFVTVSGANTYSGGTSIVGDGPVNVTSLNSVVGGTASSNLGAPTTEANGLIIIGTSFVNGNMRYLGAGETTDRTIQIGANSGSPSAADSGGAIIQHDGVGGALVFSAPTFNTPTNAATGVGANRTLTLQGSNTSANTISGIIQNNIVSGTGTGTATVGLTKAGAGNWVLGGVNTYTGLTTVNGGTLSVTGSLANNGPASVLVATPDITLAGNPIITRRVPNASSYTLGSASGLGSTAVSNDPAVLVASMNTTAAILNGTATGQADVSMQWRARTVGEAAGSNPNAVLSNVLNLTGIFDTGTLGDGILDQFVLQMSYTNAALDALGLNETAIALSGELRLGWNDNGVWKTAALGNNAGMGTGTFVGAVPYNPLNPAHNVLGAYGVDPSSPNGGVVWAVLNHNSEFAVIPEPSTLVLGGLALLSFAGVGLRRRRLAKAQA